MVWKNQRNVLWIRNISPSLPKLSSKKSSTEFNEMYRSKSMDEDEVILRETHPLWISFSSFLLQRRYRDELILWMLIKWFLFCMLIQFQIVAFRRSWRPNGTVGLHELSNLCSQRSDRCFQMIEVVAATVEKSGITASAIQHSSSDQMQNSSVEDIVVWCAVCTLVLSAVRFGCYLIVCNERSSKTEIISKKVLLTII